MVKIPVHSLNLLSSDRKLDVFVWSLSACRPNVTSVSCYIFIRQTPTALSWNLVLWQRCLSSTQNLKKFTSAISLDGTMLFGIPCCQATDVWCRWSRRHAFFLATSLPLWWRGANEGLEKVRVIDFFSKIHWKFCYWSFLPLKWISQYFHYM